MKLISKINNLRTSAELEKHVWKEFIKEIAKNSSSEDVEKLLNKLITNHEQKQIMKRLAAFSFLKQGKSYREIGKLLWLSPTTVSSIRKSMQAGRGYISRNGWWKVKPRKKKQFSAFPKTPNTKMIMPHGKLVYPQKRRR